MTDTSYVRWALRTGRMSVALMLAVAALSTAACGGKKRTYFIDDQANFGAVETIALLPLANFTADVNAPVSTTMRMVDALVKAGKRFDLLILPQETHFFQGDAREYWFDTLCRYFLENLPAAE